MTEALTRQPLNYVKMLVRESVLDLREFTVDEVVKATNCKRTSVQSEIRHMIDEGYLTTEPLAGPHQRPGKPQSVYRLVEDEEKLKSLVQEVRAFRPQRHPGPRQLSQNYQMARELLDRADTVPQAERKALLTTAENLLLAAWADEGDTGRVDDAFFKYEQGRLLFMKKEFEPAGRLLEEAAQIFGKHRGYEAERAKVWQHLFSNILEQTIQAGQITAARHARAAMMGKHVVPRPKQLDRPKRSSVVNILEKVLQAVMHVDIGSGAENPLQQSLARTFESVVESISPRAQLVNAAWHCVSAGSISDEPMRHEPWRYDYHGGNYCTVKYEGTGQEMKLIRGGPVFYKSMRGDTALKEIELAVRGPIHPLRLMAHEILGSKGQKIDS